MEPDSLKELITNNFIRDLQQIPYSSQSEVVQEYLKAMAEFSSVAADHLSTDWTVTNQFQQPIWIDYREELVDKDLGIVRKINLN